MITKGVTLPEIETLISSPGPFVSVYLNTEGNREQAAKEISLRWRALRTEAEKRGAPKSDLEAIDDVVGNAQREGDGLVAFAAEGRIVHLDHLSTPVDDAIAFGHAPHLVPYLEWRQDNPTHIVALVDRTGAEIHVVSPWRPDWTGEVDGWEWPVTRVSPGGWSQRRLQQRAENLWDENAGQVAERLVAIAAQESAELVVLAGDVRAVGFLRKNLPERFEPVVHELGGTEAYSVDEIAEEVRKAVAAYAAQNTERTLERFREELGQDDLAVEGWDETFAALREAKVDTLLVTRGPEDGRAVFAASDPRQAAVAEGTLSEMGFAGAVVAALAPDVAVRAALAGGSRILVIPSLSAEFTPKQGVGALLRFA